MSILYVSAHSKIPKRYREIDEVPPNTYIIMKVKCGEYSWVNDTAFVDKYMTTPEGIGHIRDFVMNTDQLEIDGKRIFRPGEVGPIDQTLSFKQNPSERIFLGVNAAPLNVQKIQNVVHHLDRPFLENFYRNFHVVFKTLYDNGVTGFAEDPVSFKDKNELVFNLMDMMSTYAGSVDLISYQQFVRLMTDEAYFRNFVNKRVRLNNPPADIKISDLVHERGPGIYVIDTCRAFRKVTITGGIIEVAPSAKKKRKALRIREGRSGIKKLSRLSPDTRRNYEQLITNAMGTIGDLKRRETVRAEHI